MIWSLLAEFSCKSMFLNWGKTLLVGEEIHLAAKSGVKCSSDPSTSKQEQTEEKSTKLSFDLSVACGSVFRLNYRFSTFILIDYKGKGWSADPEKTQCCLRILFPSHRPCWHCLSLHFNFYSHCKYHLVIFPLHRFCLSVFYQFGF